MAGSTYVNDLSEGAMVDATFAVQRKHQRRTRSGDPFLTWSSPTAPAGSRESSGTM